MGSSDSYDRQLDGMGAGMSSLTKICIVDRSERSDVDVNYTFIGIGIERDEVYLRYEHWSDHKEQVSI